MTPADFPFADSVRALAGWNQTLQDWQRFLSCEPEGCFVAEHHGAPVGTATTVCYESGLGWIGMLLVHPDHRRCGVGSALLQHAMTHLQRRGMRTIGLDATPLGKALYERAGFKAEWGLTRWETPAAPAVATRNCARPIREHDFEEVVALDRRAFGSVRRRLLEVLTKQARHSAVCKAPEREGFGCGMLRAGSRAWYLGPVTATSPGIASEVIYHLLAQVPGQPIFWDVPDLNAPASALAQNLGFTAQRPLARMFHGDRPRFGDFNLQFGIVDPAVG